MTQKDDARSLAEELLTDIELDRIDSVQIARRASRLARLLNDFEALRWLSYEVAGYPPGTLDEHSWKAAQRSGRIRRGDDGQEGAYTQSLAWLSVEVEANMSQINAGSNANPWERSQVRREAAQSRSAIDNVVGSIYQWVQERHYELRFGSAVETAFAVVRARVDGQISGVAPESVKTLAAAFENASSTNSEQWANAAAACRRMLKAVADSIRPPGPDVERRKMGEENYVNRLVDWIVNQSSGDTQQDVIVSDLEFLGRRLDAFTDAGNKGSHATVSQYEASRYITGTYLLLGDILSLGIVDESRSDGSA